MRISKKALKEAIEDYEYFANCMHKLCNASVTATNITISDVHNSVGASVTLDFGDRSETFRDCYYDLDNMKDRARALHANRATQKAVA